MNRMSKIKDISNKRTQEKKEDKKGAAKKEKNNQGIADLDQHRISWNELYSRLEVKPDITTTGLTDAEAKTRLAKYGENTLTEKVKVPWYMQIIHEWIQPFSLMLWAGGILCFIAYGLDPADPSNLYLGIVLCFVVMLTGIVTYL